MRQAAVTSEAEAEIEETSTTYRVTWTPKGEDKPRTTTCRLDSSARTRPGDIEQRNELLRTALGARHLPLGHTAPDNVVLLIVDPICNCQPYPGAPCAFAEYKGQRFSLVPSTISGYEAIHDRHDDQILGAVSTILSVDFLTLVRDKWDHK